MPPLRLQQQRRLQKRLRLQLPKLRPRILRPDLMHDLQKIAQVLKSNGTDGELVLGFRDIAPEDINVEEPVFIYFDGLPVPFFIESFRKKGQSKAIVRLTGIRGFDDAMEVTGQGVYAEAAGLDTDTVEDFSVLEGWKLLDSDEREVGMIAGFLDIPGNPCLEVTLAASSGGNNVIVPLHEDLIVSIDEKRQELTMSIPAGLI